jgi:hypothetical protein
MPREVIQMKKINFRYVKYALSALTSAMFAFSPHS